MDNESKDSGHSPMKTSRFVEGRFDGDEEGNSVVLGDIDGECVGAVVSHVPTKLQPSPKVPLHETLMHS